MPPNPNTKISYDLSKLRDIWFAGGCFWGVQAYFARITGVAKTTVGYANGRSENPTYYDLANSGHAETVHVRYDPALISLQNLLQHYFQIVDPTAVNRQGPDVGIQYRTAIYYLEDQEREIIADEIAKQQKNYTQPIATEVEKLNHYFLAEDMHQDYLEKHPNGYCHIKF